MKDFSFINISSIAKNTSNVLNIIKKGIPVYKELKPMLKREKKTMNQLDIKNESNKKESNEEYNNSLTFFK